MVATDMFFWIPFSLTIFFHPLSVNLCVPRLLFFLNDSALLGSWNILIHVKHFYCQRLKIDSRSVNVNCAIATVSLAPNKIKTEMEEKIIGTEAN